MKYSTLETESYNMKIKSVSIIANVLNLQCYNEDSMKQKFDEK